MSSSPSATFKEEHRRSASSGFTTSPHTDGDEAWECKTEDESDSSALHVSKTAKERLRYYHGPKQEQSSRVRICIYDWWQEGVACFSAVFLLVALAATLSVYVDRPSPNWPRRLSLNTIVATYIAAIKAVLLFILASGIGQLKWSWFSRAERPLQDLVKFDNATRSPLGASVLIWRLRARSAIASLGSLLVVLSIALDPLAQEVLQFYQCSVTGQSVAVIPRTNAYFAYKDFAEFPVHLAVSSGVQVALKAGLYNTGRNISINCPTGNCTWEGTYGTTGVCSSCKDITSMVEFVLYNSSSVNTSSRQTEAYFANPAIKTFLPDGGLSVNMTIFSELITYAAMGKGPALDQPGGASLQFLLGKSPFGILDPSTGLAFPQCSGASQDKSWTCLGYGAANCNVRPCVKVFNASVITGQFVETLVESYNIPIDPSLPQSSVVDMNCVNAQERQSLKAEGYATDSGERWLSYNGTVLNNGFMSFNDTYPQSLLFHSCLYVVDPLFWEGFITYVEDQYFNGTVIGDYYDAGFFEGTQAVQALFNFGSVTFESLNSALTNVTNALSDFYRLNGLPNASPPAVGHVQELKTCVGVRWNWLAYPAGLTLATVIFLSFTLLDTSSRRRKHYQTWKSSPLALVYHSFSGQDGNPIPRQEGEGKLDSVRSMEDRARVTLVKMNDYGVDMDG